MLLARHFYARGSEELRSTPASLNYSCRQGKLDWILHAVLAVKREVARRPHQNDHTEDCRSGLFAEARPTWTAGESAQWTG